MPRSPRDRPRFLMEAWLKINYPMDVLMPVAVGHKCPRFCHLGGGWTWAHYDLHDVNETDDLGVLLHDICVIDADSQQAGEALEAAHPVLTRVPMETTRQGRHYYMARSAHADLHGYYDCRATFGDPALRVPRVDFKSRCAGGTAGFIVSAPSTDKAWVRAPWDAYPHGELPQVTPEILAAVAHPQHPPLEVRLRFQGAEAVACRSHWLARMTLVEMFVNEDAGSQEIPLPAWISHEMFRDMLRMLDGEDPLHQGPDWGEDGAPDAEEVAHRYERAVDVVACVADFMGAPAHGIARIRAAGAGGGLNRADMMRVDPTWAAGVMAAAALGTPAGLLQVDAAMAAGLVHVPLLPDAPQDDRWLLPHGPRSDMDAGEPVLAEDPPASALCRIPACVLQLLRAEAGHLALAGGGALAAVVACPDLCPPSDFDLYIYGLEGTPSEISAAADAMVMRVAGMATRSGALLLTGHAVTTSLKDGDGAKHVVQIILRVAASPGDVVAGYDLAPAKVLVVWDRDSDRPLVLAHPDWVIALRHMAFPVDGRHWSRATALRVFKYVTKGFDAIVPALRDRSLLVLSQPPSSIIRRARFARYDGFALLFSIEQTIARNVGGQRLSGGAIPVLARAMVLEQRSDYATTLKTMRTMVHVLCRTGVSLLRRMGIVRQARTRDNNPSILPLSWRQPRSPSQFHPCRADITEVLRPCVMHPTPM